MPPVVDPLDFYKNLYEDSPFETARVDRVNKTPVMIQVAGQAEPQETQVPHYSCRITTERGRVFENVPYMAGYADPVTGSGLYVVPKAGTRVLIAYAKKGQPYIVGWLTPIEVDGRYTGSREIVPDGSIVMRGDWGNKILLLDGGVIQIQSTPVCRRTYTPSLDQIRDFCRNYFLTTAGGQFTWTESRDGQRLTAIRIMAWSKAKMEGKSVRLQIGSHIEGQDPEPTTPQDKLFSLVVAEKTKLYIGANGRIMIESKQPGGGEANDISIDVDGKFTLKNTKEIDVSSTDGAITFKSGNNTSIEMQPDGDITIKSAASINIKAEGLVKVEGLYVDVKADNVINLDGSIVRTTGTTQLAGGGMPVARLLDSVIVFDPKEGALTGFIIQGSPLTSSG